MSKKRLTVSTAICAAVTIAASTVVFGQQANALPTPVSSTTKLGVDCKDVVMVTVRGSGDNYDPSTEITRKDPSDTVSNGGSSTPGQKFYKFANDVRGALAMRGKSLAVVDAYEFGNTRYPATAVPTKAIEALKGIKIPSRSDIKDIFDFQNSFKAGIDVVSGFEKAVAAKCPNSKILLTGHSQGGGIVSTVMAEPGRLADPVRVYGVSWADSGFRGEDVKSNWSGILPTPVGGDIGGEKKILSNADLGYDSSVNGSSAPSNLTLFAISPAAFVSNGFYPFSLRGQMPPEIQNNNKSGFISVCHGVDFVCQADAYNWRNYDFAFTHGWYAGFDKDATGARAAASNKESEVTAARIVAEMFPRQKVAISGNQDILFVVDRTSSMDGYIPTFRKDVADAAANLRAKYGNSVNFGLVGYGDVGMRKTGAAEDYIFEMILQPTSDEAALADALKNWKAISNRENRDKPESMYAGVRQARDAQWKSAPGHRAIVVMTDAGNRWSDKNDETAAALGGRLDEMGIRLFGMTYGSDPDAAKAILEVSNSMKSPGGLLNEASNSMVATRSLSPRSFDIDKMLTATNAASPVANAGGPYAAYAGTQGYVTVSGAGSYDPQGKIVRYQWDMDGNGSWDCSSADDPTCRTAIPGSPGNRTARLRVTNDLGMSVESVAQIDFTALPSDQRMAPASPAAPVLVPLPGATMVTPVASTLPVTGWTIEALDTVTGQFQTLAMIPSDVSSLAPSYGVLISGVSPASLRISVSNLAGRSMPTMFVTAPLAASKDKVKPVVKSVKPGKRSFGFTTVDNEGLRQVSWAYGVITPKLLTRAKGKPTVILKSVRYVPGFDGDVVLSDAKTKTVSKSIVAPRVSRGLKVCLRVSVEDFGGNVGSSVRCR